MRAFRHVFASCLLTTCFLVAPAEAQVDDATRASARKLGNSGVEAFQAGDYPAAYTKLDKAYHVLQAPSLGLWSARALVKLGKLVEASERYLEVTRLAALSGDLAVQRRAQADAKLELDQMSAKIPMLLVQVEGADAAGVTLTIDGVGVAAELLGEERPINPGSHHIEVRRGDEVRTLQVSLQEGEHKTVALDFGKKEAPAVTPSAAPVRSEAASGSAFPARTLGWTAVIAGGASLAFGAVTGGLALQKRSTIEDSETCRIDDNQCLPDMQDTVDGYNSMRTLSTVGFVTAGVLGAAGVVLLLTAPNDTRTTAALQVSPSSVSLRGTF